jgi:predicted metal-dependent hydrolase
MIKTAKINDLEVEYEVLHRNVKNARLEIKTDKIRIIMPFNYFKDEEIIKKHEKWIYDKVINIKASLVESEKKELDLSRSEDEFRLMILATIEKLTYNMGLEFNRVYFKRMKTRWGSCSSKRNININIYLKYLPNYLIEYVVFHEIVHLEEMSHNKKFWKIISSKYPDYKKFEDELLLYWLRVRKLLDSDN